MKWTEQVVVVGLVYGVRHDQGQAGILEGAHLETHGYVHRVADPQDRRAKLVRLTDAGHEVVAIALSLVPEMERRIIDQLGERRWRNLRTDLQTIRTLFDQDEPPP